MWQVSGELAADFLKDFRAKDGIKGVGTIEKGCGILIVKRRQGEIDYSIGQLRPRLYPHSNLVAGHEKGRELVTVLGKHGFTHPPTEDLSSRDGAHATVWFGDPPKEGSAKPGAARIGDGSICQ